MIEAVTVMHWIKIISCLYVLINITTGEDQKAVMEERTACLYHGHLELTCPKDYIVILRRAQYFKSQTKGCRPNSEMLCEMESITHDHLTQCLSLDTCRIPLKVPVSNNINKCTGYEGDPFLKVTYLCEPFMKTTYDKNVKYMCDFTPPQWKGSLLYLWSPNFPAYDKHDTNCGCKITVKSGLEMQIKIPHFQPPAEELGVIQAEGCTQAIVVQTGVYSKQTICSTNVDSYTPLDLKMENFDGSNDYNIYLHFKNPNKHYIRFWIAMQVHHDYNFTVTCSKNFQLPQLLTTLSPTTTSQPSSRNTPEQSGYKEPEESSQSHWPIVTGVVAAICVVLVISVAMLLFCRRQQKNRILRQKGANEMNNFTYQNSVYMTHNQLPGGRPGSNYSSSNHSSQCQQQTEVNIEIVGRNSGSTISIQSRTSTSSPIPVKAGVKAAHETGAETIPSSVLDRLGFQSEATLKTSQLKQGATAGNQTGKTKKEVADDTTPYSSMTDLSVKDLAKLMEHQLQGNSK